MVMELLVGHRELNEYGPCGEVLPYRSRNTAAPYAFPRAYLAAVAGTGWPARPGERSLGAAAVESDLDGGRRSCGNDTPRDAYSGRHGGRPEASGGLRFRDLLHSYASWLIASGVPITDAQKVMGHENP
jgi:integrase